MSESKPLVPPTIGRRVHYFPGKQETASGAADPITCIHPSQPCDAGVVYVYSDRMVNLDVTDHVGKHHARTSVRLIQAEDKLPDDGFSYARWMNYQVQAQAEQNEKAKTAGGR